LTKKVKIHKKGVIIREPFSYPFQKTREENCEWIIITDSFGNAFAKTSSTTEKKEDSHRKN